MPAMRLHTPPGHGGRRFGTPCAVSKNGAAREGECGQPGLRHMDKSNYPMPLRLAEEGVTGQAHIDK